MISNSGQIIRNSQLFFSFITPFRIKVINKTQFIANSLILKRNDDEEMTIELILKCIWNCIFTLIIRGPLGLSFTLMGSKNGLILELNTSGCNILRAMHEEWNFANCLTFWYRNDVKII